MCTFWNTYYIPIPIIVSALKSHLTLTNSLRQWTYDRTRAFTKMVYVLDILSTRNYDARVVWLVFSTNEVKHEVLKPPPLSFVQATNTMSERDLPTLETYEQYILYYNMMGGRARDVFQENMRLIFTPTCGCVWSVYIIRRKR